MRLILIDHARQSRSAKRPHATGRVRLHEQMAWTDAVLELEALDAGKVHAVGAVRSTNPPGGTTISLQ
jgi:hypothetical protein